MKLCQGQKQEWVGCEQGEERREKEEELEKVHKELKGSAAS